MGPDPLLRKERDHQFTELNPEAVTTAMDMKARKMVVEGFSFMLCYVELIEIILR